MNLKKSITHLLKKPSIQDIRQIENENQVIKKLLRNSNNYYLTMESDSKLAI